MALDSFKIKKSANFAAGSTPTELGDVSLQGTDLEFHDGTASRPLITGDGTQTLTNKTIDADQNTITNIDNADIKTGAAIARAKLASGTASHVLINDGSGVMSSEATLAKSRGGTGADNSSVTFPASGVLVTEAGTQTLTNKTISGASNTLSNVSLTTAVTGVLPRANGGTGLSAAGTSGNVLTSDGTNWVSSAPASAPLTSYEISNLGLTTSVSSNALTIAVKQSDGSTDPSTGAAAVKIAFRSSTSTSGAFNQRSLTSALSITVPSGASLGHVSGMNQYVWVYALDNAGTIELAVSGVSLFEDYSIQSTTAISASATSGTVLYSTTARSNVPIRLIGRLLTSQTTAGTWASSMSQVSLVSGRQSVTMTDTVSFTPTTSGFGTVSNMLAIWKRVGDHIEINMRFNAGTVVAATAQIALPNSLLTNTNALTTTIIVGSGSTQDATAKPFYILTGGAVSNMQFGSGSAASLSSQQGTFFTSSGILSFYARIPVLGWSTYGP